QTLNAPIRRPGFGGQEVAVERVRARRGSLWNWKIGNGSLPQPCHHQRGCVSLKSRMSNQRRPWPMKWVIVAIIAILVPYTFLTLRYRKPGPAFQPYEDMKNQANVTRL